jgi:hypothetical protein
MNLRIQLNRSFSVIYGTPTSGNIFGCVYIRVHNIATGFTRKFLAIPIAQLSTNTAYLTGVCGIDDNEWDSIQLGFVFKKIPQLIKAPFVSATLFFLGKLGGLREFLTNSFKILYGNAKTLFFGQRDNAPAESMVNKSGGGSFAPGKPFQESVSTPRAFALNRTTDLFSFQPIFINPFRRNYFTVGKCYDIGDSKVHPEKVFEVFNSFLGNLYGLKKKELTILGNEVGLTFDVGKPVRTMTDKGDTFEAAVNSPDGDCGWGVTKDSSVISNSTKRLKDSFNLLIQFIRVGNLADTAYYHLSRKLKLIFNLMISFVMEFELIKYLLIPRCIGNFITNIVCPFNSIKQRFGLFVGGEKFNLQYQFHIYNIIHIFEEVKLNIKEGVAIHPTAKAVGFLAT